MLQAAEEALDDDLDDPRNALAPIHDGQARGDPTSPSPRDDYFHLEVGNS